MSDCFKDDLTSQVLAAGLVIAGNNALETAARIVERGKSPAQAAKEIRALKQQPPGSQPSERDKFKEMEQAFMATKEQYSELARALGFEGDPLFGDPYVKHEIIAHRARASGDLWRKHGGELESESAPAEAE